MDWHLGPGLTHLHDETGVGHDQRIRPQGNDGGHVVKEGLQLGPMRHDVGDEIEGRADGMGAVHAFGQHGQVAEVVVAHPQAVTRLAGINGGGAEGQGGVQHGQRTGRGE